MMEDKCLFERSDRLGRLARWGLPICLLANAAFFGWADVVTHASVYLLVTLKDFSYRSEPLYNVSVLVTGKYGNQLLGCTLVRNDGPDLVRHWHVP